MSNLSNKTDYRVLLIIAQMIREFEQLDNMDMTKLDDFDAKLARGLLERIVESNGYKVNYKSSNKRTLIKN